MSHDKTVIRKTVSMYPEQWDVVDGVKKQLGTENDSLALRIIVRQHGQQEQSNVSNKEE